ncbi:hypothetical protein [Kineococcus terrestris]|uniref:hypothetical protein n=1 Tax=Kineococcus terrestris TaxID=2044856 RepID=UPI0034DB0B20
MPETSPTPDGPDVPAGAAPEDVEQPQQQHEEPPQEEAGEDQAGEEGTRAGRESARYRTRLRAAEAELEDLRGQLAEQQERVAGYQRAEVERASGLGQHARLLWVQGADPAQLYADGVLDPQAVEAAARRVRTEYGVGGPRPDPSQGARAATTSEDSWAGLLGGPRR